MLKKFMLLILLLATALVLFLLWILPAIRFQADLQKRLNGSSTKTSRSEIRITEANLRAHVYRPSKDSHSTLILLPGLHPQGIEDSRFSALAEACAGAGFHVIAPDIVEFRNFRITPETVDLLTRFIVALPHHVSERSVERLGVLGISYAAGPAFLVSAQPEVKNKIHFIVSIGGYYNLTDATEFALTGHYRKVSFRMPHQWGRLIFALRNLEKLGPQKDLPLLRESLRLRLSLREKEAAEKEEGLTIEGKQFLHEVLEGLSPKEAARFIRILHEYDPLMMNLSPESILPKLDSDLQIYLLHGQSDDLIPFEETLRFEQALKRFGHGPVRSLVTASLTHVDVKSSEDFWEAAKLLIWIRAFLGEA
jgi:hypothetical protein